MARWMTMVGVVWILIAAGGAANFGVYSEAMKESLGYSQESINTIAFLRDLGIYVCIHCGIIYQFLGPRATLFLAACFNLLSHSLVWAIATKRLHAPSSVMSLLFFAISNSQMFAYTVALLTTVNEFPKKRGFSIGLVGAMFALSGAILTLFFQAINGARNNQTTNYIIFNGCFTFLVYLAALPLMSNRSPGNTSTTSTTTLLRFWTLCFAVATYLFIVTLLKIFLPEMELHRVVDTVLALFLLCVVLLVFPLVASFSNLNSNFQIQKRKEHQDQNRSDLSVSKALRSLDMAMLLIAGLCGLGSAIAGVDNLGQIGTAWGYSDAQITNFSSLMNIWNFLGRAAITFASEFFLRKYGTPRPAFLSISLVLTTVGHLVVAFKLSPFPFFLASSLLGFCLGAQINLVITITSELFGLTNFAILYSMGLAASAVGACILSVPLVGVLYDRATKRHHSLVCHGKACYHSSFLVMAGISAIAFLVSTALTFKTRKLYKRCPASSDRVADADVEMFHSQQNSWANRPIEDTKTPQA